jgi:hypothetical protein
VVRGVQGVDVLVVIDSSLGQAGAQTP